MFAAGSETYSVSEIGNAETNDPILDAEFQTLDLKLHLKRLKNGKAAGTDLIPNELWKLSTAPMLVFLCSLFQLCYNTGRVPAEWCAAAISPILKKGDQSLPQNYRPIALLNTIEKLYTSMLNSRLNYFVKDKLSEYQAGFRKGKCCQDHIFTLTCMMQVQLLKGKELWCCFVDLSQAFDTPPHDNLWKVLIDFGISKRFVRVFHYLYALAHARIKTHEGPTDPIKIMKGVLQGESASPTLFNIYINGLVDSLYAQPLLTGIKLQARIIHILLYADDIVLVADTRESLQIKVNIASKFFDSRGLRANLNKTKLLVFRKGGRIRQSDKIFWKKELLETVKSYVYLGVTFASTGSFATNTKAQIQKGFAAQGALFHALSRPKNLNISILNKLFDSSIRSTTCYAGEIWGLAHAEEIEKLQQAFYKRALFLPRNSPRYFIRLETGRHHMKVELFKSALRYWERILTQGKGSVIHDAYTTLRAASNPETPAKLSWCSLLHEMLAQIDHEQFWEQADAASIHVAQLRFPLRMAASLREVDVQSAKKSTTMPHYGELKNPSVRVEPYLQNKLPKHLATLTAQLRLGYPAIFTSGRWLTLGAPNEKPCPRCGEAESLYHIVEWCPGYAMERDSMLPELGQSETDILSLLDPETNYAFLKRCSNYMHTILKDRLK